MALSIENSPHFSERRASGALVVPDAPKFDLESYAANYDGMSLPTICIRTHQLMKVHQNIHV